MPQGCLPALCPPAHALGCRAVPEACCSGRVCPAAARCVCASAWLLPALRQRLTNPSPHLQGSRGSCLCDRHVYPAVPGAGSQGLTGLLLLQHGEPKRWRPEWRPLFSASPEMRNMFRRKWCLGCGSGYKWPAPPGRSRPSERALTGRAAVWSGKPSLAGQVSQLAGHPL